jgi:hypothetical protein
MNEEFLEAWLKEGDAQGCVGVLGFFERNPFTMDYARGIAVRLCQSEQSVRDDLEQLVTKGLMQKREPAGINRPPVYSYTRDKALRQLVSAVLARR